MTRGDVLRKCIIVFDALRRMASKGNAGLEPEKGAEESFRMDNEICDTLREMLRDLEYSPEQYKSMSMAEWQKEIMENGIPRELRFTEFAPAKAELEGGGTTWWYVCGECHGAIDRKDKYCKHCGVVVDWND